MLLSRDGAAADGPRAVRLGYCLNLHPSETLADVERALEEFVAPLSERLGTGREFGVGMYLGEEPARALASDESALERFAERVRALGVDPFTYNAFPQGGFQEDGLKERVYEPDWRTAERLAYTIDVGRVAARLAGGPGRTIAISTHPGAYGAEITDRSGLRACAEGMARAVGEFARIEAEGGPRLVLAVEAEPDASARNSRALAESLMLARLVGTRVLTDEFGHPAEVTAGLMERHLGTCLDCCHSAVEFEAMKKAGLERLPSLHFGGRVRGARARGGARAHGRSPRQGPVLERAATGGSGCASCRPGGAARPRRAALPPPGDGARGR